MNTDCRNQTGVLCGEVVRFVGDQIALVVAETQEAAATACDLTEVECEDLPVVTDPFTAMRSDSSLSNPELGDSNVCVHYNICKGDVDEGFTQAEVVVESEF